MSEDQRPESRLPVLVFGVIAALPILYVLSVGPVAKGLALATGNKAPPQWARDFYRPLRWLHDNTPLAKPLDWYLALWGVR